MHSATVAPDITSDHVSLTGGDETAAGRVRKIRGVIPGEGRGRRSHADR